MFTARARYNLHCGVPRGALSIRRKSGVGSIGMWSLSAPDRPLGGSITSHSTTLLPRRMRGREKSGGARWADTVGWELSLIRGMGMRTAVLWVFSVCWAG